MAELRIKIFNDISGEIRRFSVGEKFSFAELTSVCNKLFANQLFSRQIIIKANLSTVEADNNNNNFISIEIDSEGAWDGLKSLFFQEKSRSQNNMIIHLHLNFSNNNNNSSTEQSNDSGLIRQSKPKPYKVNRLHPVPRKSPGPWPKMDKNAPAPKVINNKTNQTDEVKVDESKSEEEEEWDFIGSEDLGSLDLNSLKLQPFKPFQTKNLTKPNLDTLNKTKLSSYSSSLVCYVNGNRTVVENPSPHLTVASFLRETLHLTGTKISCGEGGCGACTVLLTRWDPASSQTVTTSTNGCLHLVSQLDGFLLTTVEGIGNSVTGYHAIQKALIANGGSQCGYCTSGFMTSMMGLITDNASPSAQEIEDRFDGNLCRCTGYRPILQAMKTFAKSDKEAIKSNKKCADPLEKGPCGQTCATCPDVNCAKSGHHANNNNNCCDIEDIAKFKGSPSTFPTELVNYPKRALYFNDSRAIYFSPLTLSDVFPLLSTYASYPIRLVGGNTSTGVVRYFNTVATDNPTVYINISDLTELSNITVNSTNVTIGAAVTISNFMKTLTDTATKIGTSASHFNKIVDHLKQVASHGIRNVGTWAGNLMIAHAHNDFPSDLLTVLSAADAQLNIQSTSSTVTIPVSSLPTFSFANDALIVSVTLPFITVPFSFASWKIRARHQCAHPIVNAAFKFTYSSNTPPVILSAKLVYGGINSGLVVAPQTATSLLNKPLSASLIQSALQILDTEVTPTGPDPVEPLPHLVSTPAYRRALGTALFYKFALAELNSRISPIPARLQYGTSTPYVRAISSGTPVFPTADPATSPVGLPTEKYYGLQQASGEAQYSSDVLLPANALFGQFVYSTVALAPLVSIDTTDAMKADGVYGFISASDIAAVGGSNNCGSFPGDEEIFATTQVTSCGQAIGMILANTQAQADYAATLVKVNYGPVPSPGPIFTIDAARAANSYLVDNQYMANPPAVVSGDVTKGFASSSVVFTGSIYSSGQAHMYMETQTCAAVPGENGELRVYSSSQGPQDIRTIVTLATGIPASKIIVDTRRVGGGFGGKLSRSHPVATAVAIASRKFNRPVRCQVERRTDLQMFGKRHPTLGEYKVGCDANGKINAIDVTFYYLAGHTYEASFGSMQMAILWFDNTYHIPNISVAGKCCKSNTHSNTAMRAPGAMQAAWIMECVIEHVARQLNLSPQAVREANFYKVGDLTPYQQPINVMSLPTIWTKIQTQADYTNRVNIVNTFNASNRWRKRGIHLSPCKYGMGPSGYQTGCLVSVMAEDGTVQVSHSGSEMGQGIHTKVQQAVAYGLNVPLDSVVINTTSTSVIANFTETGGSGTSETTVQAALSACKDINAKLADLRAKYPTYTWAQLVATANAQGIELSSLGYHALAPSQYVFDYFCWGAAVAEVEIDVLTGELEILRVDIVYDGGNSLNPLVDMGQIEGGFVQGIGYFFYEDVVRSTNTGLVINNGTWDYHPPSGKDIPIVFNTTFLSDTPNTDPSATLSSKASGEPPMLLASSAYLAAKDAIYAARSDAGLSGFIALDAPLTAERIQAACGTTLNQLVTQ